MGFAITREPGQELPAGEEEPGISLNTWCLSSRSSLLQFSASEGAGISQPGYCDGCGSLAAFRCIHVKGDSLFGGRCSAHRACGNTRVSGQRYTFTLHLER
jgi:hypothetical protein